MREPSLTYRDGRCVPYSQLPSSDLRRLDMVKSILAEDGAGLDEDFHIRYAAILFQERGQ